MFAHGLMQYHPRLEYLPPRTSLIASSADHPKKNESQVTVHVSRKESTVSNHTGIVSKLVTSKNENPEAYSDVLMVLYAFLSPNDIQVNPSATPKQNPC